MSGGRPDAAASSKQNRVRTRPRAPAAGTWRGPASSVRASRTAVALASPEARIHTCLAAQIAGSVIVMRWGGGLGEPCTPTTGR